MIPNIYFLLWLSVCSLEPDMVVTMPANAGLTCEMLKGFERCETLDAMDGPFEFTYEECLRRYGNGPY